MSFSVRFPNILKRKQKNRVRRNITFYKVNSKYFSIISLNSYRLYISRLRVLNLFFKKSVKKFRRISKKDRFRKIIGEYIIRKHFINKQASYVFGMGIIFKGFKRPRSLRKMTKTRARWRKMKRIVRSFICFNLPKIPYTRKPIGARMGKGKGAIKAWFIRVYPGCQLLSLRNWKTRPAFYVLNLISLFLPGKNYITKPAIFKRNIFLNNYVNFF